MRALLFAAALAVALPACQTASYKQTSQLAGTSWRATDRATNRRFDFRELDFGKKLAPSGMGNVEIAPGAIALFQVIDERLVIRADYLAKNHAFDFTIDGDTLTLTSLGADGKPDGVQHFTRE